MKRLYTFSLGVLTGVTLVIIFLFLFSRFHSGSFQNDNSVEGNSAPYAITPATTPIPFTTAKRFKVVRVLEGGALAMADDNNSGRPYFVGTAVFLLMQGDNQLYDDQIVTVRKNKKTMQVGTLRYESNLGEKVVPIIKFM